MIIFELLEAINLKVCYSTTWLVSASLYGGGCYIVLKNFTKIQK